MLNNFSNTVGLPVLRIDTSEEAVREQLHEMHNYLYQLQEWLDWKLQHLEVEDFSDNKDVLDLVYPVGSVYISASDTPPGKLFGGVWEQIKGRFLYAEDDEHPAGSTGVEATHTLTVDEMPSHAHKVRYVGGAAGGIYGGQPGTSENAQPAYNELILASEGGDQPHNNMPPYYVVNMWKRVR